MKYIFSSLLFLVSNFVFSQTPGEWTWMGGDTITNQTGNFGAQGVPSPYNHPPALYEASEWTDLQGNFWLYGGDANVFSGILWKFDATLNIWTWIDGADTASTITPVYGTKGVPAATNQPGSRGFGSCSWTDSGGNLWLFGGSTQLGQMNDLWMYNIASNLWVWVSGDSVAYSKGNYGTQGVPSVNNAPQARDETTCAWVDNANNLWLFGGRSYNPYGFLDDLWQYNISTGEWEWANGSDTSDVAAVYGTKGISNPANNPGGRYVYSRWKDKSGNLWLFGGAPTFNSKFKNDLWKYDISSDQWTWVSGTTVINSPGFYGSKCAVDSNSIPAARYEAKACWTDSCGNFWLMGGWENSDLWKYNPSSNIWIWQAGDSTLYGNARYGALGVSSPTNNPGYRGGPSVWKQNNGDLWLYGGYGFFSDMWRFVPDTSCGSGMCNNSITFPIANLSSNNTLICENDCISFNNLSSNATSWSWSFNGGTPSSSTNQNPSQVCYANSGSYDVVLVASNAGVSDTLIISNYIVVKPSPPTPLITQSYDTLYCSFDSSYNAYQWYLDTALIPGATKSFLIIAQSDNYNLQVSGENGCKTAAGINIILGLQNYSNDNIISLSPNPATDQLTIHDSQFTIGNCESCIANCELYNMLGEIMMEEKLKWNNDIYVDIKTLPDGIYFVCVHDENKRWVGRFVKSGNN